MRARIPLLVHAEGGGTITDYFYDNASNLIEEQSITRQFDGNNQLYIRYCTRNAHEYDEFGNVLRMRVGRYMPDYCDFDSSNDDYWEILGEYTYQYHGCFN
jgi:hypothetical protein